ncbi:mechanosensitive ion channel [Leptospira ellisii]|uniref:Mechanosensitive ion channel n=1 Tax=Leptospira ellisii TaxID=2023197 RepID=A0A2N0BFM8_9LEPT|nr:mechanosensitive ion channel domain-containing protein [Leptospira ellisii]MDV6234582.1 mechanosensitive ion channel [Leptospira ellisii]PJZ92910.1 mechanosensitive ion channel protein [Leptospira ellisii]PKA02812.1 mechanosensitive ion channel protein [Leptospira ellisii]
MGFEIDFLKSLNPFVLLRTKDRGLSEELILIVYFIVFLVVSYKVIIVVLDFFRPTLDVTSRYNRRKMARMSFIILGLIILLPVVFSGLSYLPTVMGLAGAGIVISLKDITLNFVGWFFIHGSNGFEVGDRIEIDGVRGDVINIGVNRFTLMEISSDPKSDQSTNRLVHFPNHFVILKQLIVVKDKMNYVWDEMRIKIPYDSDFEKAEELLNGIIRNNAIIDQGEIDYTLQELSKNYLVRLGKTSPIVYLSLEEGGILFSLRYLTHVRERRDMKTKISHQILKEFKHFPGIRIL